MVSEPDPNWPHLLGRRPQFGVTFPQDRVGYGNTRQHRFVSVVDRYLLKKVFTPMLIALCSVILASTAGTTTPVWVYFEPREAITASQLEAEARGVLTERAIYRRGVRGTNEAVWGVADRPVDSAAVAAVLGTGAVARTESRWLNAVSVDATEAQLEAIRNLEGVVRTEPVRGGHRRNESVTESASSGGGFGQRAFYGTTEAQLTQINITGMHALGYTGLGVVVGVLDTGFHREHDAFHHPTHPLVVIAERDFINDDNNSGIDVGDDGEQHRHGTWCMSTIGGYAPDAFIGGAYDASFVLCKTENVVSETPVEEDYYVEGLEFAEAQGADLVTSSLGYIDWYTQASLDGATAVTTIAVNIAGTHGVHCITAAGNEGHDDNPATSTIIAPADAIRVISCGAVDDSGSIAGFSSSGPTADGRIKPEVLALGVNTDVISSRNNTGYGEVSGTSLSTPLVAAAVACLVQARPSWTPDQMRLALISSASQAASPDPLFVRGYGILNAVAALNSVCPSDWNGSGASDSDDIIAFFAVWEAGSGDFDGDSDSDSDDIVGFFAAWDSGC